MNSSAFSCGDSSVVAQPFGNGCLPESAPAKATDVNVAHHDAAALLLGGAADRRVEREVLHHRRVLVGVVAKDPLLRHGQERSVDAVLGAAMTICPRVGVAPTLTSQSANATPLGKLVSIVAVMSASKPCAPELRLATLGHGAGPSKIQALCQCEPKMRPPASAKSFTAWRMAVGAPPAPLSSSPSHDISMMSYDFIAVALLHSVAVLVTRSRRRWSPARLAGVLVDAAGAGLAGELARVDANLARSRHSSASDPPLATANFGMWPSALVARQPSQRRAVTGVSAQAATVGM